MPLRYELASSKHRLLEDEVFCADASAVTCHVNFTLDECAIVCGRSGSTHFQHGKQGRDQDCMCKSINSTYTKVANPNWDIYRIGTKAYPIESASPSNVRGSGIGNTASSATSLDDSEDDEDGGMIVVAICLVVVLIGVTLVIAGCYLRRKKKRQSFVPEESQSKSLKESQAEGAGSLSSLPDVCRDLPMGPHASPADFMQDASTSPFDMPPHIPRATSRSSNVIDNNAVLPDVECRIYDNVERPVDETKKVEDSKWEKADTDALFATNESLARMKNPPKSSSNSVPEHSHWKRMNNQSIAQNIAASIHDTKDHLKS